MTYAKMTSGVSIMSWITTSSMDYPDFYDFLAKVGLGIWDESEASEREDDSESEGRVGD